MGTVKPLAEAVERGLTAALPGLRKTVVSKLSLAVGAMLGADAEHGGIGQPAAAGH